MPRPTPLGPQDPPKVGRWRLLARLGIGGQAMVYLGVDNDGTEAAVKVLHVDWNDSGNLQRDLERELVSVRRLAPFLTARILDFDVTGRVPFIASEYIEGPTLAESVRENGRLGGSSLHHIAMQTMTALEAIHEARLIHCDVKPANIILGPHGTRVIDFGIARTLDSTHRAGEVAGTIPFMAPEQVVSARLSPKTDLFAWGSTMVFAGTGRMAFPGEDSTTVRRRIVRAEPQLYDLDESLREVVRLCLRKDPAERPTSARARRMLLGFRAPTPDQQAATPGTRPAAFAPGVAAPAAAPRRTGPDPTRREPPGARPAPGPVPRPTAPERRFDAPLADPGRSSIWWVAIAVMATLAGIVAVVKLWSAPGNTDVLPPTAAAAAPSSEVPALTLYTDDWPDASCKENNATDKSVQEERRKCSLRWVDRRITVYCIRYVNGPIMRASGNPTKIDDSSIKTIRWENTWYHNRDPRGGPFVAYTLREKDQAAIWWEDAVTPVACIAVGPQGREDLLLDAFHQHGFRLREPVPSMS